MISFDEALHRTIAQAVPLGVESVSLSEASGRVLAEPVQARLSMPRQDVSAMDGYAVRDADVSAVPVRLGVIGEAAAGAPPGQQLALHSAMRIFTGGPVPDGADRVVVQEAVRREGDIAIFEHLPGPARHIRQAGMDFHVGDTLVPAGRRLDWRALTAAAAADQSGVRVFLRPRIAIIATGDELATPGEAAQRPGMIPESVSYGVAAFVNQEGGQVVWSRRSADDPVRLATLADDALSATDLVVVIGGASVGDRDFSRSMFGAAPDFIFPKVAIKPGKPVWLARIRQRLVLGLPGNPTSALVTARLFLAPLLAGLGGRAAADTVSFEPVRLAGALPPAGDRETFVRARLTPEGAVPFANQDSSSQITLTDADLLLRVYPGQQAYEAGAMISALRF